MWATKTNINSTAIETSRRASEIARTVLGVAQSCGGGTYSLSSVSSPKIWLRMLFTYRRALTVYPVCPHRTPNANFVVTKMEFVNKT